MSHGLVLGASGAGKSFFAVQLISQLLNCGFVPSRASFGVLDAKGELFDLVKRYLFAALYRMNPEERQALKRRIVVIDFADDQSIAPYNILVRREYCADEMMVANRIDTIGEQFAGVSAISVRMKLILKYLLLLMVEFELPLPFFEELCVDELLLRSLAERSRNAQVKDYFLHRFDDENRSSLLAIRQRIDSLLVSQSVRLSLSASTAPDLTALQDTGSIILVNTAGRSITRGTSELLESFILSDLKQSVFRRTNVERKFLWLIDEAQTIFRNSSSAENAVDLLTMARSFGSFLVLLTQSLTSATRDQDILNSITGNVRWIVLLRSTLRDAGLIAPAIPLTGARHKSKRNPFEHTQHMSESEELKSRLADVTMFPDRTAYCWFKAYLDHAVKIKTPYVPKPHEFAGCTEEQFDQFLQSESVGQGVPSTEIERTIEEHRRRLRGLLRSRVVCPTTSTPQSEEKESRRSLTRKLEEEFERKRKRK